MSKVIKDIEIFYKLASKPIFNHTETSKILKILDPIVVNKFKENVNAFKTNFSPELLSERGMPSIPINELPIYKKLAGVIPHIDERILHPNRVHQGRPINPISLSSPGHSPQVNFLATTKTSIKSFLKDLNEGYENIVNNLNGVVGKLNKIISDIESRKISYDDRVKINQIKNVKIINLTKNEEYDFLCWVVVNRFSDQYTYYLPAKKTDPNIQGGTWITLHPDPSKGTYIHDEYKRMLSDSIPIQRMDQSPSQFSMENFATIVAFYNAHKDILLQNPTISHKLMISGKVKPGLKVSEAYIEQIISDIRGMLRENLEIFGSNENNNLLTVDSKIKEIKELLELSDAATEEEIKSYENELNDLIAEKEKILLTIEDESKENLNKKIERLLPYKEYKKILDQFIYLMHIIKLLILNIINELAVPWPEEEKKNPQLITYKEPVFIVEKTSSTTDPLILKTLVSTHQIAQRTYTSHTQLYKEKDRNPMQGINFFTKLDNAMSDI